MVILLGIHSLVRWIVIVVSIAGLVGFALVWARRLQPGKGVWALMSAFSGLVDVQALLGILLILAGLGTVGLPSYRIEHGLLMLVAAGIAHLNRRWRKADDATRARNNLLSIVGVLALVFIAVSLLPGNRWVIGS